MGVADESPAGATGVRVLHLIKGLGVGGAEQLLVGAARHRGPCISHFAVAYTLANRSALATELEGLGATVHHLGEPDDWRWPRRLWRLHAAERFDVVHLHSPLLAGPARLVLRTFPEGRRAKIVSTEHNTWPSYRWGTRLVNRSTFRLGDAWIAVSEPVRASLPAALHARMQVIHNGVEAADVRAAAGRREAVRAALAVAPSELLVITVANLREGKGYPTLLDAAGRLAKDDGRFRFIAAGGGPHEADLRELRDALGLGDGFRFLGPRRDVYDLLAAADLFVLPSDHEGHPLAIVEALAAGLPVVATAAGGVPELVTDAVDGRLVAPGDPEALATAIQEIGDELIGGTRPARRDEDRRVASDIRDQVARVEQVYGRVMSAEVRRNGRIGFGRSTPTMRPREFEHR